MLRRPLIAGTIIFSILFLILAACTIKNTPLNSQETAQFATSDATPKITQLPSNLPTPSIETPHIKSLESQILIERKSATWIIGVGSAETQIVQVDFQPFSWSPSGKHLLLYRDKGLYISDADGSNLRLVYTTRNPISRGTSWLNDDTILLEILVDQSEPHVYYLDVNSGNVHKPDLDYWRFIEAVSPNGDFWIQSSSKGLEIASVDGKRSVILGEYEHVNRTTQPYLNPNIVLLPDERGLVFAGCINKDCYIYLTDLAERQVLSVRPIFELGNTIPVSNFRVSPNGTYLSFVDNQNELHILNLATNKVEYQWLWNIPMGPLYYVWSPDSSAIAAPFFDDKTKRYVGLAVLDIVTGTWQQITQSSTVEYILGWRLISTEK